MAQQSQFVDVPLKDISVSISSKPDDQGFNDIELQQISKQFQGEGANTVPIVGQPVSDSPIDLVKGAASALNPVPAVQMAAQALPLPKAVGGGGVPLPQAVGGSGFEAGGPQALKGILAAQGKVGQKMVDAYKAGDYVSAARHAVDWLLPVIGPAIDQAADEMSQGRPWRGAGEAIGLGLGLAAPSALKNVPSLRMPRLTNPNVAEAEAAQFGQQRGIPVDAGTATGNKAVQGVQFLADRSLAGSIAATGRAQKTAQALERVGGELADTARSGAVTPEQAGTTIGDMLRSKVQAHTDLADQAYQRVRALETPANQVNYAPVKTAIRPLVEQMRRQLPVTQQQANPGLHILQQILDGPDTAPLSQADRDLSAIKAVARQHGGLGKLAVSQLERQVSAAAAKGSPELARALQTGRQATVAKYATNDVLDLLETGRGEPVASFKKLIAPKDSGIELLRSVSKETPQAIPQIARAYLDDLLNTATAEGGFGHTDKLFAEWQKLGPETKRILFPQQGQIADLDRFFLLAKKLNLNPNPSGTAYVGSLAAQGTTLGGSAAALPIVGPLPLIGNVLAQLGAAGLSALLHSPNGVKLLTEGLSLSLGKAPRAAQLATQARLLSLAREMGLPVGAPSQAKEQETPAPVGAGR